MSGTASRDAPREEGRAPQQRPSSLLLALLSGHAAFCAGKLSETLQQAEVKLVDTTSCNLAAYHGEVTEKMLCAGVPQGGVDTCQVRGGTEQLSGACSPKKGLVPPHLLINQPQGRAAWIWGDVDSAGFTHFFPNPGN